MIFFVSEQPDVLRSWTLFVLNKMIAEIPLMENIHFPWFILWQDVIFNYIHAAHEAPTRQPGPVDPTDLGPALWYAVICTDIQTKKGVVIPAKHSPSPGQASDGQQPVSPYTLYINYHMWL